MTVLELIQNTTAFFQRKGVESPRLSIEYLLAEALGKRRLDLYLDYDQRLPEQILNPLRDKVRRRSEGEPLQHLIGSWEFYGRPFKTDRRALIPRPETERLAEIVLNRIEPDATQRLVDVGTGSGVLAVTFAMERPALRITATDISPDALALARENAGNHGVADRIAWRETDLLSGTEAEFDFLVANLPYVPTAEIPQLSREVRYDPMLALDGGRDGLHLIQRLVLDAPAYLKTGAWVCLEIGISQSSVVAKLLEQQKFRDICIENDYQGVERFVSARYG